MTTDIVKFDPDKLLQVTVFIGFVINRRTDVNSTELNPIIISFKVIFLSKVMSVP